MFQILYLVYLLHCLVVWQQVDDHPTFMTRKVFQNNDGWYSFLDWEDLGQEDNFRVKVFDEDDKDIWN